MIALLAMVSDERRFTAHLCVFFALAVVSFCVFRFFSSKGQDPNDYYGRWW